MLRWLKDHCVPHAGNDYRPHLLQRVAMVGMLGLVLVSFVLANAQSILWLNIDWLISAVLPAVVVEETNEERADGAIRPLTRNATLDRAAQLKAEHMAEIGYFAHYAPDGTSPWHWFRSVNYPFVHAGENLAVHFNDSQEVVEAWMDSPTHRANIMNGNYTEIGIGVAKGRFEGHNTVFVVQMFGTPAVANAVANTVVTETVAAEVQAVAEVAEPDLETDTPRVAAAEETDTFARLTLTPSPDVSESQEILEAESPDTAVAIETPATFTLTPETDIENDTSAPLDDEAVAAGNEIAAVGAVMDEEVATVDTSVASTTVARADRFSEQFISTSTNLVPASIEPIQAGSSPTVGWLGRAATSPHAWLQSLYTLLALMVLGVLAVSMAVEWRRQQPVQIAYTAGLLMVMGGLYYLQTIVTTGATIALAG
jgi:hypothetical protein